MEFKNILQSWIPQKCLHTISISISPWHLHPGTSIYFEFRSVQESWAVGAGSLSEVDQKLQLAAIYLELFAQMSSLMSWKVNFLARIEATDTLDSPIKASLKSEKPDIK